MAKRRNERMRPSSREGRAARSKQKWVVVFGSAAVAALALLILLQTWPFGDHAHTAGTHGGTVHTLDGSRHLHAEIVVGPTGAIQVYPLGETPDEPLAFEGKSVVAELRADGDAEPSELVLHPDATAAPGVPVPRLVGKLPPNFLGRKLTLAATGLAIQGEPYAFSFDWRSELPAAELDRLVAQEQQDIYLRPAGRYTDDDIAANGRATAAETFRGTKAAHGRHDAKGDALCPTARLPADRRFAWVVGGKKLHFCCPQCIDEFVTRVKQHPESFPPGGDDGK